MMLTTHNAVHKINGVGRLLVVLLEGCDLQASDVNGKTEKVVSLMRSQNLSAAHLSFIISNSCNAFLLNNAS